MRFEHSVLQDQRPGGYKAIRLVTAVKDKVTNLQACTGTNVRLPILFLQACFFNCMVTYFILGECIRFATSVSGSRKNTSNYHFNQHSSSDYLLLNESIPANLFQTPISFTTHGLLCSVRTERNCLLYRHPFGLTPHF